MTIPPVPSIGLFHHHPTPPLGVSPGASGPLRFGSVIDVDTRFEKNRFPLDRFESQDRGAFMHWWPLSLLARSRRLIRQFRANAHHKIRTVLKKPDKPLTGKPLAGKSLPASGPAFGPTPADAVSNKTRFDAYQGEPTMADTLMHEVVAAEDPKILEGFDSPPTAAPEAEQPQPPALADTLRQWSADHDGPVLASAKTTNAPGGGTVVSTATIADEAASTGWHAVARELARHDPDYDPANPQVYVTKAKASWWEWFTPQRQVTMTLLTGKDALKAVEPGVFVEELIETKPKLGTLTVHHTFKPATGNRSASFEPVDAQFNPAAKSN
ncbi:MAG: hypothetical protein KC474_11185 [Cyanobacteria bacterium HKST-UBA04]|nr:hypothetical protein [Cyanobacteria bacterium HKST-UBA04]